MKIQDFDKIICLNLEKRIDRKNICNSIFVKHNIVVEYFKAIDGNTIIIDGKISKGAMGASLSHKKIFEYVQKNNWNTVLILEDDIEFHEELETRFEDYYREVPSDWKMIYFGGNHCFNIRPKMISEHVCLLQHTYALHCYAIKQETIQHLLEQITEENIYNKEIDVHLADIQKKIPCYGFIPHLAWQKSGYSDIEKQNVNYDYLKIPPL